MKSAIKRQIRKNRITKKKYTVGCKIILHPNATTKDSLSHASLRSKESYDNLSLGGTVCTGIESSAPKGNSTATASILNSKPTPGGREFSVGGTVRNGTESSVPAKMGLKLNMGCALFDFFKIEQKNREYFGQAILDSIGLYSLVHWRNIKHYTYTDNNSNTVYTGIESSVPKGNSIATSNIIEVDTTKEDNKTGKDPKIKFIEQSIQTSLLTKRNYTYLGSFYKRGCDNKKNELEFKCSIFKNTIDSNYIIFFKWGQRVMLNDNSTKIPVILDKMFAFIVSKLIESNYKNNKILLFGYSMGGNIAQHIALRFLNTKYKLHTFFVSLGIGGTLDNNIIKQNIESAFAKHFISIAIIKSPYSHTKRLPIKYNLNTYILPDNASFKTIKTLIIHADIILKPNSFQVSKYKIKGFYDYNKFFTNKLDNKKNKNKLHEAIYYKALLEMLINGETEKNTT
jgi:hypothetical protein